MRRVALSLLVYEAAPWVDVLLENALRFAAPTTRLMLHVNSMKYYDASTLSRWNSSSRVGVNPQRVPVTWGTGSITLAHVLNCREIARRWPSTAYVVLQASNMLFFRPGFEQYVAATRCSLTGAGRGSLQRTAHFRMHPFYAHLLARRANAHHYAEGSFYPLGSVLRFGVALFAWLDEATVAGTCWLWQIPRQNATRCGTPHPRSWYQYVSGVPRKLNSTNSTLCAHRVTTPVVAGHHTAAQRLTALALPAGLPRTRSTSCSSPRAHPRSCGCPPSCSTASRATSPRRRLSARSSAGETRGGAGSSRRERSTRSSPPAPAAARTAALRLG